MHESPLPSSKGVATAPYPARDIQQSSEIQAPRGMTPETLWSQVTNTAPFIENGTSDAGAPSTLAAPVSLKIQAYLKHPAVQTLRAWNAARSTEDARKDSAELTHPDYFALCLAAHHATVATFVPTDVDNQIRFKLWSPALDDATLRNMAEQVLESKTWPSSPLTAREVRSPESGETLSGHDGEWLSTAVPAYAVHRTRDPKLAADIAVEIRAEIAREARIFADLRARRDGIGLLKAATLIAHNLGDFDRVIEMWNLHSEMALRLPDGCRSLLTEARAINKEMMAEENHRHFALRKPRAIRARPEYWLPLGPFFDEWGLKIGTQARAQADALSPEQVAEVAEALIDGWQWFRKTKGSAAPVGYTRALAGLIEGFPGGANALSEYLPATLARTFKSGELRSLISIPRERFEAQWEQLALNSIKRPN